MLGAPIKGLFQHSREKRPAGFRAVAAGTGTSKWTQDIFRIYLASFRV